MAHGYVDEAGPPRSGPFVDIARAYTAIGQISHESADFLETVRAVRHCD